MTLQVGVPAIRKRRTTVLQALSLTAPAGRILGVIGPNGAGKSTLLRSIAGQGEAPARLALRGLPLARGAIGFLPQAFQVTARLTVTECVLLGRRETLGWHLATGDLADAAAVLDRLGLAGMADRELDSLSGGQQQMVLLAQRLLRRPVLMLLDEPTSALDLRHQLAILQHLRAYARDHGAVVILALHDLTLAARFCDRLLLLAGGRMVATGAAADVLTADRIGAAWGISPEILVSRDGAPVIVPHPAPGVG